MVRAPALAIAVAIASCVAGPAFAECSTTRSMRQMVETQGPGGRYWGHLDALKEKERAECGTVGAAATPAPRPPQPQRAEPLVASACAKATISQSTSRVSFVNDCPFPVVFSVICSLYNPRCYGTLKIPLFPGEREVRNVAVPGFEIHGPYRD